MDEKQAEIERAAGETNEEATVARISELKQRVRWAAEIAVEAGEFKDLAFAKTLDRLFLDTLGGGKSPEATAQNEQIRSPRTLQRNGGLAARKPPRADPAELDRIRLILDANPEVTSRYAAGMTGLPTKFQVYAALEFAATEFKIASLTLPELREVLKQNLRIGMPDGTLRGILSRASATELGRSSSGGRETAYQLMQAGLEALAAAKKSGAGATRSEE